MGRALTPRLLLAVVLTAGALFVAVAAPAAASAARYAVFPVNDLGMHCYQRSYAGFMILPPANNLKVQVFRKGGEEARAGDLGDQGPVQDPQQHQVVQQDGLLEVRLQLRIPRPRGQRGHHRQQAQRHA